MDKYGDAYPDKSAEMEKRTYFWFKFYDMSLLSGVLCAQLFKIDRWGDRFYFRLLAHIKKFHGQHIIH